MELLVCLAFVIGLPLAVFGFNVRKLLVYLLFLTGVAVAYLCCVNLWKLCTYFFLIPLFNRSDLVAGGLFNAFDFHLYLCQRDDDGRVVISLLLAAMSIVSTLSTWAVFFFLGGSREKFIGTWTYDWGGVFGWVSITQNAGGLSLRAAPKLFDADWTLSVCWRGVKASCPDDPSRVLHFSYNGDTLTVTEPGRGALALCRLGEESLGTQEMRNIQNGMMLAHWLMKQKGIGQLLLEVEELDWLEFKTSVLPRAEDPGTEDAKRRNLLWHISKGILSIANTGGGVMVFGRTDNSDKNGVRFVSLKESCGYTQNNKEEFIRRNLLERCMPVDPDWPLGTRHYYIEGQDEQRRYSAWRSQLYFDLIRDDDEFFVVYIPPIYPAFCIKLVQNNSAPQSLRYVRSSGMGSCEPLAWSENPDIEKDRKSTFSAQYYRLLAQGLQRWLAEIEHEKQAICHGNSL